MFSSPKNTVALHIDAPLELFLRKTGFVINSHDHLETIRQIFDILDGNFIEFTNILQTLPKYHLLTNKERFVHLHTITLTPYGVVVKETVQELGLGIYFLCHQNRIFGEDNKIPYILNNMYSGICMLEYSPKE